MKRYAYSIGSKHHGTFNAENDSKAILVLTSILRQKNINSLIHVSLKSQGDYSGFYPVEEERKHLFPNGIPGRFIPREKKIIWTEFKHPETREINK